MSARVPCATLASLSPVEGSVVSKYCPAAVPVEPKQRFARVFRRRAIFHTDEFFDDAHALLLDFLASLPVATRRLDDGSPPSSVPWHGARVAVRCPPACCWRRSETDSRQATPRQAPLSSETTIPSPAWPCGCRRPP